MTSPLYAVLFGKDEMLNLTRRWILERTGLTVVTCATAAEADKQCAEHSVDLLAICYTALGTDCDLVVIAAEKAHPKMQTLWLRPHGLAVPAAIPLNALLTSDGPHEMFVAARKVVESLRENEAA